MKVKFVLFTILPVLALLSSACGAQDATNVPVDVTATATVAADEGIATEEVVEATMTSTGAVESATPTQESGGAAGIPQTGPGDAGVPDDLDEVIRVLRETGATVELGDAVEQDVLPVPGQIILINGEEVQIFTYASAEEVEVQASQLEDMGDPESEPHFYKLGTMLVRYVGSDPGVRDLLEDVLGAHAAGE